VVGERAEERAAGPAMADLVTEYVAELPPQVGALLAELDVLRSGGDPAQLKRIVHQLKGAGGGYGFAIVTDHAKAAEARIIEGAPPAEIRTGVERLIATLRRIDGYDTSAEQPAAAA
ncbi:MAG: Hpt domain-containing protein, partial [Planctomycetota bacterium]